MGQVGKASEKSVEKVFRGNLDPFPIDRCFLAKKPTEFRHKKVGLNLSDCIYDFLVSSLALIFLSLTS
jgi:hypothetical protein